MTAQEEKMMIIDHPYIQSAKIVTSYDEASKAVNTLVVETTVEIADSWYHTEDYRTHELMDLLSQLRSFAEHDFADFQALEVHSPHRKYFARNMGHAGRIAAH